MPTDKAPPRDQMKVTDKRIFTAEGEIREEFRDEFRGDSTTADPSPTLAPPEPAPEKPAEPPPRPAEPPPQPKKEKPAAAGERGRTVTDRAQNPGTPFTNFLESLIVQAYMSLGMLRNPYQPQAKVDPPAARQMIEILTLLHDKTAGNLTDEEEDFLTTHLGELKLAFVQRTKSL
ncbi:MAG TPA: DUF1844 domain-containing protein [Thermoanaerobaculia bacterium]|nr:DUF1844 domain-containing protein [Thermoanaerobaculia bacterium]